MWSVIDNLVQVAKLRPEVVEAGGYLFGLLLQDKTVMLGLLLSAAVVVVPNGPVVNLIKPLRS